MTTFFTSDTHFGHANIINLCHRPFGTVNDMDDRMVANWNARVSPQDTVYHLGDFTLAGENTAVHYLRQLNGKIHLIHGNHDLPAVRALPIWASSGPLVEIKLDGRRLTLCHYAMRVWHHCERGSLMLYGHSHGNLLGNSQSLDVGVDAWDYFPVTLDEILTRMARVPVYTSEDHHLR